MTDEQIKSIIEDNPTRYRDAGAWLPVATIAELLCTGVLIPNPTPQGQVLRKIDLQQAIGALSKASIVAIGNKPILDRFIQHCDAGDMEKAKLLIGLAVKAEWITPQEAAALVALDGTVPDPAWQATITGPPPVDTTSHEQVARVLESMTP